jgi:predicted outer membrane repeat protein
VSTIFSPSGLSSVHKPTRVVAGVASIGVLASVSLVASTPVAAATATDCEAAYTLTAPADSEVDIQVLLDNGAVPVVCLSGTFVLTQTLTYARSLTIFGLSDAVLDGNNAVRILNDDGGPLDGNSLTVENLRLTQGAATSGAAISAIKVTANNSVFDNNSATLEGGAISSYDSVISGSTFTNNSAGLGGAISPYDSVVVTGSTFTNNSADYDGGAIFSYGSTLVSGSTFTNNSADLDGGAIFSYGSTLAADSSTFTGNSAGGDGGAIDADDASVRASSFVDNSADDRGGAISMAAGIVTNSTFVRNNTAVAFNAGGAIFATGGDIRQSTFLDNSTTEGEGESLFGGAGGLLTVQANIFAGTGSSPQISADNTVDDLGGNMFSTPASDETFLTAGHASSGFGFSTAILFDGAVLANNGGPTQTIALYPESPAVDFVPAELSVESTDQRGDTRSARGDAGAFEYGVKPAALLPATGFQSTSVLGAAAALLLALGGLAVGATQRLRRP